MLATELSVGQSFNFAVATAIAFFIHKNIIRFCTKVNKIDIENKSIIYDAINRPK